MKDTQLFESVERELNRQKDIMGDVNLLMKLKNLQDKEFVKSMGQNMLMFNHIVGHKQILQFI